MNILKQVAIIFFICWLSIVIEKLLPFTFPSTIISLLLMLILLILKLIKVEHIKEKSDFLLANMAFFFIPAGVSMINYLDLLLDNLFSIIVICLLSTIITFMCTAYSMLMIIKIRSKRNG